VLPIKLANKVLYISKLVSTGTFHGKFYDHLVEVTVLSALVFDADDTVNKKCAGRREKRGEDT